jgi:hypothetical protein
MHCSDKEPKFQEKEKEIRAHGEMNYSKEIRVSIAYLQETPLLMLWSGDLARWKLVGGRISNLQILQNCKVCR